LDFKSNSCSEEEFTKMKTRNGLKLGIAVFAVLALGIVQPASASVVGHIDFVDCASGGVTVAGATIDFFLPVAAGLVGNNGCILAGGGSTITFAGGSVAPGATGTVNDLGFAPPGSGNAGFITFPGVMFNLITVGPGITSGQACSTTLNPANPSCSVTTSSPFVLTPSAGVGTIVSFSVSGSASETGTPNNSTFAGAFSTQITKITLLNGTVVFNPTPAQIQADVLAGGSISSTFSFGGDAFAGAVPEPVSMALIGGGLIAFAFLKRWKARA
jgi:hypothetical protein